MVDLDRTRQVLSKEVTEAVAHVVASLEQVRESPSPDSVGNAQSWVRFIVVTQLVPSVMAATCAVFASESADWSKVVNTVAPELLDDLGDEPLSLDATFLEEVSKSLDPKKWAALSQNLGDQSGFRRLSRESFDSTLDTLLD